MIRKWVLNNFKSVSREVPLELEFRPLTIFSGANSSGKSTILQSILLVAQTLQSQNSSRSVALNGRIRKFGSYSDVVNGRDINKNIRIGFSLSPNEKKHSTIYKAIFLRTRLRIDDGYAYSESDDEKYSLNCEFVISSGGKKDCLMPEIDSVHLDVDFGDEKEMPIDVVRWDFRDETEEKVYNLIKDKYPESVLNYKIDGKGLNLSRYANDYELDWKPVGVSMRHFLPSGVISYYTLEDKLKKYLQRYLQGYGYTEKDFNKQIVPLIKEKALDIVEQLHKKDLITPTLTFDAYDKIKKRFTLARFRDILRYAAIPIAERNKYQNQLVGLLSGLPEKFHVEHLNIHDRNYEAIEHFFSHSIDYLGPLRDEPRSFYPLANEDTTDVGLKGENTAAVYHIHQLDEIDYISPESFGRTNDVVRGTLAEAVNQWLVYLGVASDVNTADMGKFGHELKISSGADIKMDLTHVGVGVSQVLPILVMAFLAKKGDVIILEQPELHLHPKVQTRLADFFVSMNALGKQCLIETHSEYMINRLRYHVAVAEDSKVADDTMIYFVEKDKATGNSNYRPVTINRYGVIEDWPEGFFDESERIARDILEAGMAKKMKETDDYEE